MLRPATDDDVHAILRWRNQAANRSVSLHSHVIAPEEHAAWWERSCLDPKRRVLIYQRDHRPVGVVNFFDLHLDAHRPSGAWGFYLDSEGLELSGETLPAWIEVMREATEYAFTSLGLDDVYGEVLEHNRVVRQMNRRFGFVEGEPETRVVDDREVTVVPISLSRENRATSRGKQ